MPRLPADVVRRRLAGHAEYRASLVTIRRLLDSLVGGQTYREATYGRDLHGLPVHNLVRHKRERPNPQDRGPRGRSVDVILAAPVEVRRALEPDRAARDPAASSGADDFELRRARTPVPEVLSDVVSNHLDRIARHEIARSGPPELEAFWADVDGRGSGIEEFVFGEVGPIYFAAGKVDLLFERPWAPEAEGAVLSLADERRLGLDRVTCTPILPENLLWWRLDGAGRRYEEVIYREYLEDDDGNPVERFRHWDAEGTRLHDGQGELVEGTERPNPYGAVPVLPCYDRRKPGTRNTPLSFYEPVAERMREVYNLMSELVISDTLQAHPILCLPEDYCRGDSEVPVGAGFALPIRIVQDGTSKIAVPPAMLDIPKGPTESLRASIAQNLAMAYWHAGLEPPAPVSQAIDRQSGISKEVDLEKLNGILAKRARALARLEATIVEGWRLVTGSIAPAEVHYPSKFGSFSAEKLTGLFVAFQALYPQVGALPENDRALLKLIVREMDPGRPDADYRARDAEIDAFVDRKAVEYLRQSEAKQAMLRAQVDAAQAPPDAPAAHVPEGTVQPERRGVNGTPERQGRKRPGRGRGASG